MSWLKGHVGMSGFRAAHQPRLATGAPDAAWGAKAWVAVRCVRPSRQAAVHARSLMPNQGQSQSGEAAQDAQVRHTKCPK